MSQRNPQPFHVSARLGSESGFILPLIAMLGVALVIFAFGFCIDWPTQHAATEIAYSAVDIGNATAAQTIYDYKGSADSAFATADAILRNQYATSHVGTYSKGFDDWNNNKHSIWIPKVGQWGGTAISEPSFYDKFKKFICTSGASDSCADITDFNVLDAGNDDTGYIAGRIFHVLSEVYDQQSIDDFKNAITFYTHFRPYHYLAFLPEAATEVVSTVRLRNTMTYIVVDPAFSLGDQNYNRVFGVSPGPGTSNGTTDTQMWPFAAFRQVNSSTITYPLSTSNDTTTLWHVAANSDYAGYMVNTFKSNPVTGAPFQCSGAACPAGNAAVEQIFKFYAATCDSMPFFHFKAGVVNFIDRLTATSAYNSTTIVSLTGYFADDRTTFPLPGPQPASGHWLVPVYPANIGLGTNAQGSLATFDYGYPMPTNASEPHNHYMHKPGEKAYTGYINSGNSSKTTGAMPGSGKNQWDLAYCRGLYDAGGTPGTPEKIPTGAGGGTVGFALPEDLTNPDTADDDRDLSHSDSRKRVRRSDFVTNWVDDSHAAGDDYDIDLGYARGNNSPTDAAETPRNLVGNLAMRMVNPHLEKLSQDLAVPSAWAPPISGAGAGIWKGYRYVPTSLTAACQNLDHAVTNYKTPSNFYSKLRPVEDDAIALFAFGIYDDQALVDRGGGTPITHDQAMDEFRDALEFCLCGHPQRKLFLSFLPMDAEDRDQDVVALTRNDLIQTFAKAKLQMCSGQTVTDPPCGGSGDMGSIFTFFYDWKADRFGPTPYSPADDDLRKQNAAEAFDREIYDIIWRLMVSYAYST